MDPNLFHVDWDRLLEVLLVVIVLALFLERALAIVFESRLFVSRWNDKGVKELVAVGSPFLICEYWSFDALSIILPRDRMTHMGMFLTACIVAGGSKGAVKLFRDVLGVQTTVAKEAEEQKQAKAGARAPMTKDARALGARGQLNRKLDEHVPAGSSSTEQRETTSREKA